MTKTVLNLDAVVKACPTEVKIAEAEKNLKQLNEYKTKLLGGLETLSLLLPKPEETQDGVPEPSQPPTETTTE